MNKTLFLRYVINKKNKQINLSLPKKLISKDDLKKLMKKDRLKIILEDF
jgi:hypothetical protein